MKGISCHSQAEKSPNNVLEKFADARILPFYIELNRTDLLCNEAKRDDTLLKIFKIGK